VAEAVAEGAAVEGAVVVAAAAFLLGEVTAEDIEVAVVGTRRIRILHYENSYLIDRGFEFGRLERVR
jgi:hypothetical protein